MQVSMRRQVKRQMLRLIEDIRYLLCQQVQLREGRHGEQASRTVSSSRGGRALSARTHNPFELMWHLSRDMDRLMSAAFTGSPLFGSNFRSNRSG
jgi:hypothetical protein